MRVNLNLVMVLVIHVCQVPRVLCGEISYFGRKAEGQWAFSPVATLHLVNSELGIYHSALDYQNSLKQRLQLVDRWIEDYEVSVNRSTDLPMELVDHEVHWKTAGAIAAHPLMTLRMMRRFAYYLEKIYSLSYSDESGTSLLDYIDEMNATTLNSFPTPRDLLNVTDNIIRLQNVYDLSAADLIAGIIANKTTLVGLTPLQAFEIGKHAKASEMYPEALDWFRAVQEKIQKQPDKDVEPAEVADNIRQLILEHDALHDTINDTNFYDLNLNRFHSKIISEYPLETEKASQKIWFWGTDTLSASFAFKFLCNGDDFRNETEKSKLYCWYERKSNLFWTINPLKIEVHSWEPYIIQIYDVVGEKVMEYLKTTASPQLYRSEILQYTEQRNDFGTVSPFRTSSQTFLAEHEHPPLKNMEKIIGSMVGLEVQNAFYTLHSDGSPDWQVSEPMQVAAYTFGGHFLEHNDALGELGAYESTQGDRIATFMIYLNDVELGGYTAFPTVGTAIAPVKGSAVFWYDLWKNGTVDKRNMHGGCPVIIGEKWIGNKWIHYNANFQKRRCSLNPLE